MDNATTLYGKTYLSEQCDHFVMFVYMLQDDLNVTEGASVYERGDIARQAVATKQVATRG